MRLTTAVIFTPLFLALAAFAHPHPLNDIVPEYGISRRTVMSLQKISEEIQAKRATQPPGAWIREFALIEEKVRNEEEASAMIRREMSMNLNLNL
ncbi:hypothetical protein CVT24_002662 [Panaeolus cyanescens]|uniref:Uncharacterized protein n=1 Tax=Panaeolus cyanescens TaxID=181874 RepID=A0A409WB62_9AGAR|nr:hypothetical protein CVT24_002662 [Panaeolus cyanescens]